MTTITKRSLSAAFDSVLSAGLAAALITLLAAILLLPAAAIGSPEIAKKEGMKCTQCHDKAGSKLLTDKGKYYEAVGSMAGYDDVIKQYKACTTCHSNEPGSLKLTPEGESLKAKGETMKHIAKQAAK